MDILTITISVIFLINGLLVISLIFIERKDPSATWAWMLVISLIPIIGFILYLFLGQNLSRKKIFDIKTEEDKLYKEISIQIEALKHNNIKFNDEVASNHLDMIHMHQQNHSLFTQNNKVKTYTNGNDKFDQLIKDIRNAKHHIHMLYYIINSDDLGNTIVDELTKKAQEGVEVRFAYDAMGARKLKKNFFGKLQKAGGKIACFFPATLSHINIRMNYRNHRKIVVIDGQIGYVGGINIGDEYLGKSKKFGYWRDTHLRICGDAINTLQYRFILDWNYASKENKTFPEQYFPQKSCEGSTGMQIVSCGPDSEEEEIKNGYLKMITSAKESICIQSPYFVPDKSIVEALKVAALCGVDVKIMIPNKPDHPLVYWATYSYLAELLNYGVKAYTYEKGFLHCKTLVVDKSLASVGTANMDIRSYKLNFEINAFIYDHNVSKDLHEIFITDINDCIELTKDVYNKRCIFIKFKESIARLLSPIL